jgi:predicted nucleic acid-binding protein
MVLVDTSVWIRTLAGKEPYVGVMNQLSENDRIVGHDLVHGELLVGDVGGRTKFLAEYDRMDRASLIPHSEVVILARFRKLHGRGLSWIDVHLLASAMIGHHQLYTADLDLADAANELGVAYVAKSSR